MTGNLAQAYAPLLIHFLVAMALAGVILLASSLVGRHRPNPTKQQPYECGITPTGDAREPFSVQFYLVAMVFILFDIEAIFLYPWAYVYRAIAVVRVRRNADLHRHPAGGLRLLVEKRSARLGSVSPAAASHLMTREFRSREKSRGADIARLGSRGRRGSAMNFAAS